MAVQISGNDITVPRDTTVTRNLTVGGVLTYEDVTNVDSIGIVTARAGVLVGSGITLSKDGDIFATGVTTTGSLVSSGDVNIADKIIHTGDTDTTIRFPSADTIRFDTGGTEAARITSEQKFVIGDTNSTAQLGVVRDSYNLAEFTNTNADATGAELSLRKDSASPADNDSLGTLNFIGDNDAGQKTTYAYIQSKSTDVSDGTEDGDVRFFTRSAGTLAERHRIDSSGKFGIGMSSDQQTALKGKLDIDASGIDAAGDTDDPNDYAIVIRNPSTTNQGNGIAFTNDSGAAVGGAIIHIDKGTNNIGDLSFLTSASSNTPVERLRITSAGTVGIGEDDPDGNTLLIRAASTVQTAKGHIMLTGDSATVGEGPQIVFSESGSTSQHAGGYVGFLRQGSNSIGDLVFGTRGTSGDANTVPTERLRIDSDGRLIVGGGTHAGGSALVVKGGNQNTYSTIGMFGSQTNPASGVLAQLRMGANTTAVGADIRAVADNQWGSSDYPTRLEFGTVADGSSSRTERMRILSSGHTKISNNGTYQSSTAVFHEMRNSSVNQHTTWFTHTGVGDVQYGIRIQTANEQNDTSHNYIDCREGGSATRRFIVYANGNVQNQNNSYGSLSDEKLKENITDANSQWDDIKTLKVRNFNFINDSNKVKYLGLVAQEAETVCPSLVFTSPDTEDDSETGEIKETGTETKSLKYSVLYMKAIKCLQEAQTRIETLETEVAALKSS